MRFVLLKGGLTKVYTIDDDRPAAFTDLSTVDVGPLTKTKGASQSALPSTTTSRTLSLE